MAVQLKPQTVESLPRSLNTGPTDRNKNSSPAVEMVPQSQEKIPSSLNTGPTGSDMGKAAMFFETTAQTSQLGQSASKRIMRREPGHPSKNNPVSNTR